MLGVSVAVVCGGVLALSLYLYTKLRRPPGFPPGPPAYPILGSIPCLNVSWGDKEGGYHFIMEMERLAQKYGPIFSIAIGHRWTVFICKTALIKESLKQICYDMAGRPDQCPIHKAWNPQAPKLNGILYGTYSEQWKLQHNTVLQILKNLGYGHSITEAHIHEETDIIIESFRSKNNEVFCIKDHIGNAVANIIIRILFGERYEHEDKEFQNLRHNLDLAFDAMQKTITLCKIPGITFLPLYKKNEKVLFDSFRVVLDFLYKKIAEHSIDEVVDQPRNFVEGYQTERKKNHLLEDQLVQILMDLFQAGLEATSTTLSWAILFMIMYPEIQRKVQEELDEVVGRSRKPRLTDRASLPYMMATINEILRLATTVPFNPRCTLRDCQVGGYTIPNNTDVMINNWSVLRDPMIWPDPLVLKPDRFLDAGGQLQQPDMFIPFGIGPRTCLGEQLAKQELFIFFSNLLHHFTFTSPDGVMEPVSKGIYAISHNPPDYCIKAKYRD